LERQLAAADPAPHLEELEACRARLAAAQAAAAAREAGWKELRGRLEREGRWAGWRGGGSLYGRGEGTPRHPRRTVGW
jgi:hypothetical protein